MKPITFYVKDSLSLSLPRGAKTEISCAAERQKKQTFIVDANKVSISKNADHQTSMVNCLPVKIKDVSHIESGVLISGILVSGVLNSGQEHKQILRSIITTKSLLQLNIQLDDIVYFVFKAL
jgi:ABC-type molybdate transport system ATPase subunit